MSRTIQTIEDFKSEVDRLLALLVPHLTDAHAMHNFAGEILPPRRDLFVTFDHPIGDATPFVEGGDGVFDFVISERGTEYRRERGTAHEVLGKLFIGLTSQLTHAYGFRRGGAEPLLDCFDEQERLLALLDAGWAAEAARQNQPHRERIAREHG